jgi:flagellar hook-associated protein 2
MATSTAVGGSQIDVQSLVSQLVAAERATVDTQIARASGKVTTQISALGSLMGSMSAFRTALSSLKTVDVFTTRTATSSNTAMFTATASTKAVPGTYAIEVTQIAKAQQISSNPFVGGSTAVVGTGTLAIAVGDKQFSVDITAANSSLGGIRDAINAAAGDSGVTATLVHGTGGSRLVLSSSTTGAANKIVVSQTGGDGGLSQLAYSAAAPGNYTQLAPAQDAIIQVANAQTTSATNTIVGAIDGVTLELLKETGPDDDPATVSVSFDSSAVSTRIGTFVTAYNALASQIAKLRSYDATTQTAGPMLGDSMLQGIESQLRRTLVEPVAGQSAAYQTLASIGITTQLDGTLAVDEVKLQKAMTTNFEAVGKLFGSENGVGARLFSQVDERLKTGGGIDTRSKNLVEQQKALVDRKTALDARMAVVQAAYLRQFTALDTMLSKMQVTSSYLSQQIESLQNLNKQGS